MAGCALMRTCLVACGQHVYRDLGRLRLPPYLSMRYGAACAVSLAYRWWLLLLGHRRRLLGCCLAALLYVSPADWLVATQ